MITSFREPIPGLAARVSVVIREIHPRSAGPLPDYSAEDIWAVAPPYIRGLAADRPGPSASWSDWEAFERRVNRSVTAATLRYWAQSVLNGPKPRDSAIYFQTTGGDYDNSDTYTESERDKS